MDFVHNVIETELGVLDGRDAIHVDKFEQKFNKIIIEGEVNSRFCKEEYRNCRWYSIKIVFDGIKAYKCENIDIYHWKDWNTQSCFEEISDSDWANEYKLKKEEYKHLILETYDYVYFILCKKYEFKVTGER